MSTTRPRCIRMESLMQVYNICIIRIIRIIQCYQLVLALLEVFLELRLVCTKCVQMPMQEGSTALSIARQNGHTEVVRLLLRAGAKDFPNEVES